MNLSDVGSSYSDVWFSPYAEWRVRDVRNTYEVRKQGEFLTPFSSIHEFEKLVLMGGWIALCSEAGYTKQWNLTNHHIMVPHGESAVGWEKFLRHRTESLCKSLSNRKLMEWINDVPYPKRLLVLHRNSKSIQKAFNEKLLRVPWMKTK
jgi:hypothetical protein